MTELKDLYREEADSYDLWGSALGAHFDVCEELLRQGEEIPCEWGYSPGMVTGEVAEDEASMFRLAIVDHDADELRAFGNLLDRYARVLKRAGRDY